MAVALPPRSAPKASDHHSAWPSAGHASAPGRRRRATSWRRRGCCRRSPTAPPSRRAAASGQAEPAVGGVGERRRTGRSITPVSTRPPDHDEQTAEEDERRPLDVGERVLVSTSVIEHQQARRRAAPRRTARSGAPGAGRTPRPPAASTSSGRTSSAVVLDRLALVERHHDLGALRRRRRTRSGTAHRHIRQKTTISTTTHGAMWTRKSLKDRSRTAGDDDVGRVAHEGRRAADVGGHAPRRSGTAPGRGRGGRRPGT